MFDVEPPPFAFDLATDRLRADFLVGLVAMDTGINGGQIRADRRASEATRARHMAMYLAHVGFGWPLHRVALAFARDRSTVSHACHIVEDLRESREFDDRLQALEACVKAAPLASAPLAA